MRVQVAGRQVDVGEALKSRIEDELSHSVEKYFASRPADAVVTVSRDGPFFEVDCVVHLDSGINLQVEAQGADAHAAFTAALDKMETRIRRYKRKLKNHHNGHKTPLVAETAAAYVLAATDDESELDEAEGAVSLDAAPLVVAETQVKVPTLTVSMAVLQLDLASEPALLFRNAGHGGLNLVYRRADGNIGWVDPQRTNGSA
jgi:ribosomal subunit interface protein